VKDAKYARGPAVTMAARVVTGQLQQQRQQPKIVINLFGALLRPSVRPDSGIYDSYRILCFSGCPATQLGLCLHIHWCESDSQHCRV